MFWDKFFEYKHSKLVLSVLLFILGFCILGLPYYKYYSSGFDFDSATAISHGMVSNIRDFLRPWQLNDWMIVNGDSYAEAFKIPEWGYASYYRPILFNLFGLEYLSFGLNTFLYYLFNVFLHSVNSILLLNILNWFFPLSVAFLGALFFLLNGCIFNVLIFLYAADFFNLLCFLCILIFLKKYLYSNSYKFYLLSSFFFFLAQFSRDVLIFLPFILFVGVYLFYLKELKFSFDLFWITIKKTYLYFLISFIYLIILFYRMFLFWGDYKCLTGIALLHWTLNDIGWSFAYCLKDLMGTWFLEFLNGKIILIIELILFFFIFYRSGKFRILEKSYLLFLIGSIAILSWPIYVAGYSVRYIYPIAPIFIFVILFLVFRKGSLVNKKLFCFFVIFLILIGAGIKRSSDSVRFLNLRFFYIENDRLIKDFAKENKLNSKSKNKFVFLACPGKINALLKNLRLISGSDKIQVYEIGRVWIDGLLKNLEGPIVIKKIKNGFQFVSLDENIYFYMDERYFKFMTKYENNVGKFYVNELYKEHPKVKNLTFIFNKEWLKQNSDLQFFIWDFKNEQFVKYSVKN